MQKFHSIIAWLILILFIIHLIMSSVTLLTSVFMAQTHFLSIFFAAVCVHAVVALWKVVRGKRVRELCAYPGKNKAYWARILSGIAIFVLVLLHRNLWTITTGFGIIPKNFNQISLMIQLLFIAAIGIHILLNIRPLLIDSGLDPSGRAKIWVRMIMIVFLLLAVVSVVAYYLGVSI